MNEDVKKTEGSNQELVAAIEALKTALKKAGASERSETGIATHEITATEYSEILALLEAARELFAEYAATLTPTERQRLIASNVRNIGFIQSSYMSAEGHHSFLPSYLSMTAYTMHKDDFERKRALLAAASELEQEISDSMLVASDVVYRDSLAYYNTLKEAVKQKVPGAESEFNMLKTYFNRSRQASAGGELTEAQIERDVRSLLHGTKEGKIVIEKDIPAVEKTHLVVKDNVHSPHESIEEDIVDKASDS